jgi:hypothetical protein
MVRRRWGITTLRVEVDLDIVAALIGLIVLSRVAPAEQAQGQDAAL